MNVNFTPEQGKACLEIENAELKQENQRLNNVLNELKKDLQEAFNELQPNELIDGRNLIENILNELKESDK